MTSLHDLQSFQTPFKCSLNAFYSLSDGQADRPRDRQTGRKTDRKLPETRKMLSENYQKAEYQRTTSKLSQYVPHTHCFSTNVPEHYSDV